MFSENAASGKSTTPLRKATSPRIFDQHKLALMGQEKKDTKLGGKGCHGSGRSWVGRDAVDLGEAEGRDAADLGEAGCEGTSWIWEKLREGGISDQNTVHERLKDLKCHLKLQHAGTCLMKGH